MKLNNKITIFEETEGDSRYPTSGGREDIRSCWAFVDKPGMKDYQLAYQNGTINEFSFTVRQSSTEITNKMKVEFDGMELQIKNVQKDYKNKKYMLIICEGVE